LTELSYNSGTIDLPLQIVQGHYIKILKNKLLCLFIGLATGTILYVIFFEIFPKAKQVGGTGTQHILAMVLGFAIFIPSLYFRKFQQKKI
jgi:zinc transporter ZupT